MNTVKRRWPDLLIGLLVLLLLGGFAALLLGRGTGRTNADTQAAPVQEAGQTPVTPTTQTPTTQTPTTQTPPVQTPTTQAPQTGTPPAGTGAQATDIPTIPSEPVTDAGAAQPDVNPPATATVVPGETTPATDPAPRAGGAVAPSEVRTPTRNDYRISLGSYASSEAVQAATAGVSGLGYTVYPIAVESGAVAQVGPFASREAAAQALADIQRALPGALLYPPRNAPAGDTGTTPAQTVPAQTSTDQTSTAQNDSSPSPAAPPAASGPVYLQVGAYRSTTAAQTTVSRVRSLGLEPSVNAPAGRLVTVLVGPFQGRALAAAEARLQAGGIDSFRVR